MRSFVLDTSVAVAWYLSEAFREYARVWQARLLGGRARLVVPSLHYWEFANVLRTYVRRGEIEPALAKEIYSLHVEAPLEIAEPEPGEVLEVALEYGATAYDAVYIALSQGLGIPLLTAERTTTPWVARLGRGVASVHRG